MLQCSTILRKFCKSTVTVITCLTYNCCIGLLVAIFNFIMPAVSVGLLCVAFMCSTYECYSYIKDIPVMICTTGMLFVVSILGIIFFIYYIYMVITGQKKQYRNNISTVIKLFFSNFLKKPNSENEEEKFIVLGYEASLKEMHWLIVTLVQASLLAFAQFWDDFLLEVSSSCSTNFNVHCFYTTDSILTYQELNCLNTSQVKEAKYIICYKYVFNTGRAAASAIGIISATGLIIYAVCILFFQVLDGARWSKCGIRSAKAAVAGDVMLLCTVLGIVQMTHTIHATTTIGLINLLSKPLAMGTMIATSIFLLPVDKFRKSANRDGYELITNEPQHDPA